MRNSIREKFSLMEAHLTFNTHVKSFGYFCQQITIHVREHIKTEVKLSQFSSVHSAVQHSKSPSGLDNLHKNWVNFMMSPLYY